MMPFLFFLVGISGSGKSTIAQEYAEKFNAEVFSYNKIRFELYGDESVQDNPQKVFQILHKRIKTALKQGKNAIYDATNLLMKRRKAFLKELQSIPCFKICVVVNTPFKECLTRNSLRKRQVPYEVLKRQRASFQCPYWYEGWDDITITNMNNSKYSLMDTLEHLKTVPHDNPNHSLTIGKHMEEAQKYCTKKAAFYSMLANKETSDENAKEFYLKEVEQWCFVALAAKYHDIGKSSCKTFFNKKGEQTEVAHYYQHQNISAYSILSELSYNLNSNSSEEELITEDEKVKDWLKIVVLVQWHMEHYIRTDKSMEKFKELIGKELVELLDKLHEADKAAH